MYDPSSMARGQNRSIPSSYVFWKHWFDRVDINRKKPGPSGIYKQSTSGWEQYSPLAGLQEQRHVHHPSTMPNQDIDGLDLVLREAQDLLLTSGNIPALHLAMT